MEEKRIKSKHITLGFVFLVLFAIFIVIGFIIGLFLIPAFLFGIAYLLVDKKYLRCPNCGAFNNMDKLLYAKKNIYHCNKCGNVIGVEKN